MKFSHDRRFQHAAHWAMVFEDPEASPADIQTALDWMAASSENQAAMDQVGAFLALCEEPAVKADLGASFDTAADQAKIHTPWTWSLAIAASILFLIAGGALVRSGIFGPQSLPAQVRYASAAGEMRTISLEDGSVVTMGGATTILVRYDSERRVIQLDSGEAVFEVKHNPARPFIVEAGDGSATAVGTAFNVHRDPGATTVTVLHGQVEVLSRLSGAASRARLGAAMQVSYGREGTMASPRRVDLSSVMAWRNGRFEFSQQPLAIVAADLNRYSSVPIIVEKDVAAMPVSGIVDVNGIHEWLQGLSLATGIEVVDSQGKVILRRDPQGFSAR